MSGSADDMLDRNLSWRPHRVEGPLRVGMVVYGLDRPLSGVTRVTLELGRALRASGLCNVTFLTAQRAGPLSRSDGSQSWALLGCQRLPGLMLLGGPMLALAARKLRLDIVHDPSGISPFTLGHWADHARRVLTIHDAIAFRYPEGYPTVNNLLHRRFVPATVRNVDRVITDSRCSGRDIVKFVQVPSSRVTIVPLGVGTQFAPLSNDICMSIVGRYGLAGRPYILSVGMQAERKNLERLLDAFARVSPDYPDYRLVLVGPTLWRFRDLRSRLAALGIQHAVSLLGYIPERDLPALYGAADLFVFPSLYEGFGLPVLEAMACGTPVVCSGTSSLPEVTADAAVLVDPTSVDQLSGAIARALGDDGLRRELRRKGLARASEFTWQRAARETVAAYLESPA